VTSRSAGSLGAVSIMMRGEIYIALPMRCMTCLRLKGD
jgi:hypothetical protein